MGQGIFSAADLDLFGNIHDDLFLNDSDMSGPLKFWRATHISHRECRLIDVGSFERIFHPTEPLIIPFIVVLGLKD
jgi:hypothetical protein